MGRVGGFATFDVGLTAIGAAFVANKMDWPYVKTLVGLWTVGEIMHMYFGINTPVTDFIRG